MYLHCNSTNRKTWSLKSFNFRLSHKISVDNIILKHVEVCKSSPVDINGTNSCAWVLPTSWGQLKKFREGWGRGFDVNGEKAAAARRQEKKEFSKPSKPKGSGKEGCRRQKEKTKGNGMNLAALFTKWLVDKAMEGQERFQKAQSVKLKPLLSSSWPLITHHSGQMGSLEEAIPLKSPREGISLDLAMSLVKNSSIASFHSALEWVTVSLAEYQLN